MSDDRQTRILAALRDLFDAIAQEVRANPSFAGKIEASLANAAGLAKVTGVQGPAAPLGSQALPAQPPVMLNPGVMSVLRNLPASPPPPPPSVPAAYQAAKDAAKANTLLNNISFDPLECHIEAALLGGREQEARSFLNKLDRWQLEEVVKAQRLPGTRNLQKAIYEGDTPSAVEAIVGSAFERIRNRLSTAR
jgi:hypothetical protein